MRRTLLRMLVVTVAALAVVASTTSPGHAWVRGSNDVVGVGSVQTGRGPGWVALSYKVNGPVVGYLLASEHPANPRPGPDQMYVRGSEHSRQPGPMTITRWPWGYAGGDFGGCAFAYGTSSLRSGTPSSATRARCAGGPTVPGSSSPGGLGAPDRVAWWHSHQAFCTDPARHALCSPRGVWSANNPGERDPETTVPGVGSSGRPARVVADSFVVANIGAAAVFGTAAAQPTGLIGGVHAGDTVGVRYVTRSGWAMVRVLDRQGGPDPDDGRLVTGMVWGFVPVDHLQP